MSVADKVLILSTLFLGIVAIFGPAYSDQFKAWWLRPVLNIDFRMAPPDCHLTTLILVLSASQKSKEPVFYYRLRVGNTGRSQARKCEMVLESIAIGDPASNYVPLPTFTPVRLLWGAGFEDFVDINPERRFFCDLFTIPNEQTQKVHRDLHGAYVDLQGAPPFDLGVVLNVKSAFFSQPSRLPPGKYRLDLSVYSENADRVQRSVYVAWSGNWRTTEQEMFRECVATTSRAA